MPDTGKRTTIFALTGLGALVAVQVLAAAVFVTDLVAELGRNGLDHHTMVESLGTAALVIGAALGLRQISAFQNRALTAEATLQAARASFADMIRRRFDLWQLTQAERDVALLQLKGFDIAEIARLRDRSASTIRVQLSTIYGKAGVANAGGFAALFLDDLVGEPKPRPSPTPDD